MKYFCVLYFGLLPFFSWAQNIQSDCTPEEMTILKGPKIVAQFDAKGTITGLDCTHVKNRDREFLATVLVIHNDSGYESYFALFDRKTFTANPESFFKSTPMGFDLFPMLENPKHRLIY